MRLMLTSIAFALFLAGVASTVSAEPLTTTETEILDQQLGQLESRVIQRQGRPPRTRDRLTDSDLGVAERRLNTLKTRRPGADSTPLLERQLDRARRPIDPRRVDQWRPAVR
jgi:hypothetical protein